MRKNIFAVLTILVAGLFLSQSAPAAQVGGVDIHGFVSQGYLITTNDVDFMVPETHEGTFEFNEIGINFSSSLPNLSENLSIGAQLMAFDFGDQGNNEVKVDWAYGDYAFKDYLGVRAGIMKIPHGLYNETRKVDMIRPGILLPTSVYPEFLREAMSRVEGAGVYGTLFDALSYQAIYGHVSLDADGGLAQGFETLLAPFDVTDMDTDDAYYVNLQWDTPLPGLKLGASYSYLELKQVDLFGAPAAVPDPFPMAVVTPIGTPPGWDLTGNYLMQTLQMEAVLESEPIEATVASVEYQRDRLTLAAEYVQYELEFDMTFKLPNAVLLAASLGDPFAGGLVMALSTPQHTETTWEGFYGQVAYRLLDNLELGAYYSKLYWDKGDHNGSEFAVQYNQPRYSAWLEDVCLAVRYDINSNWCAKVEAHNMDGSLFTIADNDDKWQMYEAKLSYMF